MKIVIVFDLFKESVIVVEVVNVIKKGWIKVCLVD